MENMIENEEGKSLAESPAYARMGAKFAKGMAEKVAYEDIMSANWQKPNAISAADAKK